MKSASAFLSAHGRSMPDKASRWTDTLKIDTKTAFGSIVRQRHSSWAVSRYLTAIQIRSRPSPGLTAPVSDHNHTRRFRCACGLKRRKGRLRCAAPSATRKGKPVDGVTIHLQAKDSTQTNHASDRKGSTVLPALAGGVYVLRAEMAGYSITKIPALFFGPKEARILTSFCCPQKLRHRNPRQRKHRSFLIEPRLRGRRSNGYHESRRSWLRHGCANPGQDSQRNCLPKQSACYVQPGAASAKRKLLARQSRRRTPQL